MKRLLSLTLCAILLLGVAIPVYALNTEENPTETTVPSESVPETTAAPADETKEPQETDASVPTETTVPGATVQEIPTVTHIDGCSDDCTKEDCDCPCHEKTLFERLMACTSLEELFTIADETPLEDLLALTDEENSQIKAKIAELEPEPLPPVVVEDSKDEPVVSEIIYPAVNFDNVAPFGDPIEG